MPRALALIRLSTVNQLPLTSTDSAVEMEVGRLQQLQVDRGFGLNCPKLARGRGESKFFFTEKVVVSC